MPRQTQFSDESHPSTAVGGDLSTGRTT
jgi:hypothetical protein